MTSPRSVSDRPAWPFCGQGADGLVGGSVGCRGRVVEPYRRCLAHLDAAERHDYLSLLGEGSDVDHRGTTFATELLDELSAAVLAPGTGHAVYGDADFGDAVFAGPAVSFGGVTFSGRACFEGADFVCDSTFERAVFSREARLRRVRFTGRSDFTAAAFAGRADFRQAVFSGEAAFERTVFSGGTEFDGAELSGPADFRHSVFSREASFSRSHFTGSRTLFDSAEFSGNSSFDGARFAGRTSFAQVNFSGPVEFRHAVFSATRADFGKSVFLADAEFGGAVFFRDADFDRVRFEGVSTLGPLMCVGTLNLSGAVFSLPVTVMAAARTLVCGRTRWMATALLRLRYATVDLTDAVGEYPLAVVTHPRSFTDPQDGGILRPIQEPGDLRGLGDKVKVRSLSGVDAAHVSLTDIDLSGCRFAGTVHLDQLSLKGRCTFADAPAGMKWRPRPARWTPRRTLVEEHHWRHRSGRHEWNRTEGDAPVLEPAALAAQYRELRKAFEDGKNEPGAADFYYGEMEMRRNDPSTPPGERGLLALYWAVSGYGLRVSRSLGWLVVAMAATVLLLMLWGLAANEPKPLTTGTQASPGQAVELRTDTPDPVNPTGPLLSRLSTERFEKSLRIVINSVVFRSGGQELTTAGTYFEMSARIGEPVLLGLSVLALRGRVKR
ncbi:pentapeptide repeat-containing protein [Streptomyces niveus]|uniref:pentapeptide repeat-containing protein n=1 Tax=Streptomyces niveus TaxID=193462 RepID=UPI0036A64E73